MFSGVSSGNEMWTLARNGLMYIQFFILFHLFTVPVIEVIALFSVLVNNQRKKIPWNRLILEDHRIAANSP